MITLVEQPKADAMGLYKALKDMGAPVILRPEDDGDGVFVLSAEDNYDRVWADYWDHYFGVFGVAGDVYNLARNYGMHPEWINPGCVGFHP